MADNELRVFAWKDKQEKQLNKEVITAYIELMNCERYEEHKSIFEAPLFHKGASMMSKCLLV